MRCSQVVRDLTRGQGPGSLARACAAWDLIADEMASVADDYDAAVAELMRSLARTGADATALTLERFSRWLREISLCAAATAHRAERASIAHSVAVLALPAGSAEGSEADDRHATQVMCEYRYACDVVTRPWRTPQPPGGAGCK
ncbi:PPE family protein [Mycolicibacterium rutilum]|uniref:PPE family protein n=1 Tax=Mycolicibacterium rutilum TaxID=370526 RepID=A0A1H6IVM3_MYCRU|nr:PPE family protein [Mycolicibacterium rutilum]